MKIRMAIIILGIIALANAKFLGKFLGKKFGKFGKVKKIKGAARAGAVAAGIGLLHKNAVPIVIVPIGGSPSLIPIKGITPFPSLLPSSSPLSYPYFGSPYGKTFSYPYNAPSESQNNALPYPESYRPGSYAYSYNNQYYDSRYPISTDLIKVEDNNENSEFIKVPEEEYVETPATSVSITTSEHTVNNIDNGWNTNNSNEHASFQPIVPLYLESGIQDHGAVNYSNTYTGEYETSYTLQDGTYVTETSKLVEGKNGNKYLIKKGTYKRSGENGESIAVNWIADENGFRLL